MKNPHRTFLILSFFLLILSFIAEIFFIFKNGNPFLIIMGLCMIYFFSRLMIVASQFYEEFEKKRVE